VIKNCAPFLLFLMTTTYCAMAQTAWPPAPFILETIGKYNPDIFRMDHVAGCPGNGLEQDKLYLQWQRSVWLPPNADRNDSTDTVHYEINFIVENHNGPGTITVPFLSANGGVNRDAILRGDELYEQLFRPPVPHPVEPDSIVIRVPWFVRAWNRAGSTYSDTAGVTIRNNPLPARALVMSYNRPPSLTPPTMIQPLHNAIITGIGTWATTPPLDFIWTRSFDRNIRAGQVSGVFRRFNPTTRFWEFEPKRTVDTLSYQWVGTVVRTAPPGRGAPIGTVLARQSGTVEGVQLLPADFDMLFGGLTPPPTAMTADTVVLDYLIYVKDYHTTDFTIPLLPLAEVTFRYRENGTLYPDTSRWSRFGCRPHEQISTVYRITLVRDGIVGVEANTPLPYAPTLHAPYPNPASAGFTVEYTVPGGAAASLEVLDILGQSIKTLSHASPGAGTHRAVWDGNDSNGRRAGPGNYILRLRYGNDILTRMVTLLR
jgi:hypothetical protein